MLDAEGAVIAERLGFDVELDVVVKSPARQRGRIGAVGLRAAESPNRMRFAPLRRSDPVRSRVSL
jgi:hypothetical protein